jgi:hypothetical protein
LANKDSADFSKGWETGSPVTKDFKNQNPAPFLPFGE